MADVDILIVTIALAVLIALSIRSCLIRLRDNSQAHERGRRKAAVDKSEMRHDTDGQEEDWRLRDAENRQALEKEMQKFSHLFQDSADEGDVVEFTLPGKRSRLASSSTDCESAIRADPPRRRRRHREQRGGGEGSTEVDEGSTMVDVCRTPGWIQLQGPLAHTTDQIIYWKINDELEYHQNKHPSHNMYMYIDKKFELSRRDDMAVMSLIQGTDVARYMTGDTQQALTRCKQLLCDRHTYHLKYPAIVESQLYWQMCMYYRYKGKPGKAHSAMQVAVSCIQHHAPSAWTGQVYDLQGAMHDRLAHVRPGHRSKYQDLAVRCLTQAREHHLSQPCQEMENYLYYPLCYTLDTALIKLDMPTIHTIAVFCESEIVHQRLSECVVSQCQVTEAQDLVTSLTPHLTTLIAGDRAIIDERILICKLIMTIRFTQLAMHDKAHHSALSFMNTALDLYDEWFDHASGYTGTHFDNLPLLSRDIVKTLDTLSAHLRLTSPPTPPPEPLSDSLSSEPSDAPPSGLKQLTDESRRAEKQARRDAHEFSYSSGDVYSDHEADVNSDVN